MYISAKELHLSAINCRYLHVRILQLIRDFCNLFQISARLLEICSNKYRHFIWYICNSFRIPEYICRYQ